MKRTASGLLAAAGFLCAFGLRAEATTLDFADAGTGGFANCIEHSTHPCFGDNASGTPDITTEYSGAGHRLTAVGASGHGGGYVFSTASSGNPYTFRLDAASGFNVQLNELTIKNAWLDPQSDTFEVWADGTHLASLDFNYSGEAPFTQSFTNLIAHSIWIVADSALVGIAGVDFSQVTVAATPIPAALPLFASGLLGLGFARWRRNKRAVKAA